MTASRALLVKADGGDEELVLKAASETAHNDRLVAEGEVLARLAIQTLSGRRTVGWSRHVIRIE